MRRKKLHVYDLILKFDLGIIKEARVCNKDNIRGTLFTFDKFTDEMVDFCLKWQNTQIVTVQSQYAPEQVSRGLIIFDKCLVK